MSVIFIEYVYCIDLTHHTLQSVDKLGVLWQAVVAFRHLASWKVSPPVHTNDCQENISSIQYILCVEHV